MPVKIPEIQRMGPVADASVGRLEAKVPDSTKSFEQTSGALARLGGEVVQQIDHFEAQAADTEATKRDAEYHQWAVTRMSQLREYQGDPTEAYNKFDEEMSEKFNELSGDENLSPRTREAILKKITNTSNHLQLQRITQAGAQTAKYEEGVAVAAIEIKKNALIEATTLIDPKDPSSLAAFDSIVAEIIKIKLKLGVKIGTVVPDENGNTFTIGENGEMVRVQMDSSAQYGLAKELSEGVYNAMENLIKSGNIDKAEMLKEKYGQYLDPVKRKQIADDFQTNEVERVAYLAADSKDMSKVLSQIEDPVERAKARDKAETLRTDRAARRQRNRDLNSKGNMSTLASHLQNEMQKRPNRYVGMSELQADPIYKELINKMEPKHQKAIHDLVFAPKVTTDEARVKFHDLLLERDEQFPDGLRGMSSSDLLIYTSGMKPGDRDKAFAQHKAINTDTGAEEQAKYRRTSKKLMDALIAAKYVKSDMFGNKPKNAKELDKFLKAESQLIQQLSERGPMSPKEEDEIVKGFSVKYAKGEAYTIPERPKFKSKLSEDLPENQKKVTVVGNKSPGNKSRIEWAREMRAENPKAKMTDLDAYIERKLKGQ